MGKFRRFYKNVSGSTIYVPDMNNWEIKPDAEVDLDLVPEGLLDHSIQFGRLIALNKLVPLPERVAAQVVGLRANALGLVGLGGEGLHLADHRDALGQDAGHLRRGFEHLLAGRAHGL